MDLTERPETVGVVEARIMDLLVENGELSEDECGIIMANETTFALARRFASMIWSARHDGVWLQDRAAEIQQEA